jgi:hypothetical protein
MIILAVPRATGVVTKGVKENLELYKENSQQIHYKRQLYQESHT